MFVSFKTKVQYSYFKVGHYGVHCIHAHHKLYTFLSASPKDGVDGSNFKKHWPTFSNLDRNVRKSVAYEFSTDS